jgi:Ca2+/H+ antiporter, TMEM165/GDT1 family
MAGRAARESKGGTLVGFFAALGASSAAIFVAEMGDKTQLMVLSLASRYRLLIVLVGITVATVFVFGLSVLLSEVVGWVLPVDWLTLIAGLAFLAFGAWTLRGDDLNERDERRAASRPVRSGLLTVMTVFFVAELGDKSMLATVALGTQGHWLPVWIGAVLGMTLANGVAIALGAILGKRVPERAIQIAAAVIFFLMGAVLSVQGLVLLAA